MDDSLGEYDAVDDSLGVSVLDGLDVELGDADGLAEFDIEAVSDVDAVELTEGIALCAWLADPLCESDDDRDGLIDCDAVDEELLVADCEDDWICERVPDALALSVALRVASWIEEEGGLADGLKLGDIDDDGLELSEGDWEGVPDPVKDGVRVGVSDPDPVDDTELEADSDGERVVLRESDVVAEPLPQAELLELDTWVTVSDGVTVEEAEAEHDKLLVAC